MDRVVVAGGTESLSSMVLGQKSVPASAQNPQTWMSPANPPTPEAPPFDMALTVGENTARIAGVTREAADEWAYHSHIRAARARDEGLFDAEIVPVPYRRRGGTRSPATSTPGRTPPSRSSRRCP